MIALKVSGITDSELQQFAWLRYYVTIFSSKGDPSGATEFSIPEVTP